MGIIGDGSLRVTWCSLDFGEHWNFRDGSSNSLVPGGYWWGVLGPLKKHNQIILSLKIYVFTWRWCLIFLPSCEICLQNSLESQINLIA